MRRNAKTMVWHLEDDSHCNYRVGPVLARDTYHREEVYGLDDSELRVLRTICEPFPVPPLRLRGTGWSLLSKQSQSQEREKD